MCVWLELICSFHISCVEALILMPTKEEHDDESLVLVSRRRRGKF